MKFKTNIVLGDIEFMNHITSQGLTIQIVYSKIKLYYF